MARRSREKETGTTIPSPLSATDSTIGGVGNSPVTAPTTEAHAPELAKKMEDHPGRAEPGEYKKSGLADTVRELDAVLAKAASLVTDAANLDVLDHGVPTLPEVHALAVILRGAVEARRRNDNSLLEHLAAEVSAYVRRLQGESAPGTELRDSIAQPRTVFADQLVFTMRSLLEEASPENDNCPSPPGWMWRNGRRAATAEALVDAFERTLEAYPVPARSIVQDLPSTILAGWKIEAAKAVARVLSRHEREHLSETGSILFDTALDGTARAVVKAILRERGYPNEKAKSLFDAAEKAARKRSP